MPEDEKPPTPEPKPTQPNTVIPLKETKPPITTDPGIVIKNFPKPEKEK